MKLASNLLATISRFSICTEWTGFVDCRTAEWGAMHYKRQNSKSQICFEVCLCNALGGVCLRFNALQMANLKISNMF